MRFAQISAKCFHSKFELEVMSLKMFQKLINALINISKLKHFQMKNFIEKQFIICKCGFEF